MKFMFREIIMKPWEKADKAKSDFTDDIFYCITFRIIYHGKQFLNCFRFDDEEHSLDGKRLRKRKLSFLKRQTKAKRRENKTFRIICLIVLINKKRKANGFRINLKLNRINKQFGKKTSSTSVLFGKFFFRYCEMEMKIADFSLSPNIHHRSDEWNWDELSCFIMINLIRNPYFASLPPSRTEDNNGSAGETKGRKLKGEKRARRREEKIVFLSTRAKHKKMKNSSRFALTCRQKILREESIEKREGSVLGMILHLNYSTNWRATWQVEL